MTVANPLNFVSVHHKKNEGFTLGDLPCHAASSVDSITDNSTVFCRVAPLASGVDTVRATQMHVNIEFCSLPRLFVPEMTHTCETVKMHVSASILVNTVAYGLDEGKQLIKKMDG